MSKMTQKEVNKILKEAIKLMLDGFSKEADREIIGLLEKLKAVK